jgi:hypothetical protein
MVSALEETGSGFGSATCSSPCIAGLAGADGTFFGSAKWCGSSLACGLEFSNDSRCRKSELFLRLANFWGLATALLTSLRTGAVEPSPRCAGFSNPACCRLTNSTTVTGGIFLGVPTWRAQSAKATRWTARERVKKWQSFSLSSFNVFALRGLLQYIQD